MVDERKVPQGYRMTEVGVVPEDWITISFGEAFKFLSTGNNPRSELKEQGDVQYIHYGDIHTKWRNILDCSIDSIPYIDEKKVKYLPKIEEGDLVVADASEDYDGLGISVEVKNVNDNKIVAGLHTFLLRPDKSIFVNGFKGYIQYLRLVRNQLKKIATGISVYGISKNNLKDIIISVPTLGEQQSIVQTLSDVDNLIISLEKLIDKRQKIKQGTMQQLLTGKKRLPGFTGEWELKKLGDICSITTGKLDANAMTEDGEYRFYTCAKKFYKINVYAFDTEALLVSGNGANVGYIHYYKGKFNAYQRTYVLTDFTVNIQYIKVYMEVYLSKRIQAEVNDGNTPYIKKDTLSEMIIKMPADENEQNIIANLLTDMDSEIEVLKKKLQKYKAIKQGMMRELLTGRIRLI